VNQNSKDISKVLNEAFTTSGSGLVEDWKLLYSQGNSIYATKTRIAKIARTQDEQWVEHGLRVAIFAGENGIKAVQPIINTMVETQLGKATLWPRINHYRVEAINLNPMEGSKIGEQVALISKLKYGQTKLWEPFHRLEHRVSITDFPEEIIISIRQLAEKVSSLIPLRLLDSNEFLFAHGDVHIGNMLFNEDINIIDFDSANWYPKGWDIAFLYNHLVLENNNKITFDSLKERYIDFGGYFSGDIPILCLVKALISTTYGLTLEANPKRIKALAIRLETLGKWVNTLEIPESLPTFKYFD